MCRLLNRTLKTGQGLIVCLLCTAAAQAQGLPPPVQALVDRGITIVGTMPAPAGFKGYVGEFAGQKTPVYLLPDGRHTTVGVLYDEHGKDLTNAAFRAATAPRPDPALWDSLGNATWIAEGAAEPERVVYVFTDTECPYCHRLWLALQPWLKRGKAQVRNVIVAVIAPESLGRGAAVLTADDPATAWRAHESAFGRSPVKPLASVDPQVRAKIEANRSLMARLGAFGTPAIVYRDRSGRIRMELGLPDQAGLQAIFGH
ncbi:MAG TPA: thiol:disulfide interchange protein DsbG [Rhodanobacteraceae bacterium]|nr:thiol:disulfide interchange protein DsbG [Rhodanobacteraceae bacterium]